MENVYNIEIQAQPSIYAPQERTLRICFSEPDAGVDKDTGLLLLIAGYGENISSPEYDKMREWCSNSCNLITVQCNYFGCEYMQNNIAPDITMEELQDSLSSAEFELLQRDYDRYFHILKGKTFHQKVELDETPELFNEMGLMQAIDNLRAVKVVMDIVKDNGYKLNEQRIYAYGCSQGAYLSYLCNALWPGLFTGIVDNSGFLSPYYLEHGHQQYVRDEDILIRQERIYRALEFVEDREIYSLPHLYKQFKNQADIICFAGEKDEMVSLEEKKEFISNVENAKVETITKFRIDMVLVKTTTHGLGADFVGLFRYAYGRYLLPKEAEQKKKRKKEERQIRFEDVSYDTKMFRYEVKWEEGIPMLYRFRKE